LLLDAFTQEQDFLWFGCAGALDMGAPFCSVIFWSRRTDPGVVSQSQERWIFFGKILFLGFIFDLITWIAGHGLCASAPAWAPSMRRGMPADRRTCTSTSIHDPSEHWLLRIPLFELLPSLLRVTLLSLVLVACGMRFSRVLLSWRRATAAKLK